MKTKEELNTIKEEVETLNEKLQELTPEEIAQVNGGRIHGSHIHDFGQHVGDKLAVAVKATGIDLSHDSVDGSAAMR